jgi:hypothetical protein
VAQGVNSPPRWRPVHRQDEVLAGGPDAKVLAIEIDVDYTSKRC